MDNGNLDAIESMPNTFKEICVNLRESVDEKIVF